MRKYVLGLETGIDGGSIAILENGELVDSENGSGQISKSEDLLSLLEDLLQKNFIDRKEIHKIVVSGEPGSLTGIRIGIATAKGIADALRIRVEKVSILEAMVGAARDPGNFLAAIITHKKMVYFRQYSINGENEIRSLSDRSGQSGVREFAAILSRLSRDSENTRFVCNKDLWNELINTGEKLPELSQNTRIHIIEDNPATVLGRFRFAEDASDNDKNNAGSN